MTNFDFLKSNKKFEVFADTVAMAERLFNIDFASSAINCRKAVESAIKWMYSTDEALTLPADGTLISLMQTADFKALVGVDVLRRLDLIRKVGNSAVHESKDISRERAELCLENLFVFFDFVAKRYDANYKPQQTPAPTPLEFSEYKTRQVYIDVMLKEAGWEVLKTDNLVQPLKASIEIEVQGMPNNQGIGFCDYVLFGADGKPLAVVEAKKTSVKVEVGKHQAELYANCLEKKYGTRPVIYYTNGYDLWVIDGLYPPRQIYAYHTADELRLLINRRKRGNITNLSIDDNITNRGYQKQAIKSVCERFNHNHRRALLVMATGTGKTRVAISLTDILTKNNWVKNVLFLADRTALVRQAKKNFAKLLPNFTVEELSGNAKPNMNARFMFSTYQTMINYVDGEDKEFSTGRFDLIIIDEAHRSIFNKYGAIFDYFDSLLVGLTATPRGEIAKNTYDIFDCEHEEPTDEYTLEEAISDGFLVPYKVNSRSTNILTEGIDRDKLSKGEQEEFDNIFGRGGNDDEVEEAETPIEIQTKIAGSEIFKRVYNKNTCRRVIEDLMTNGTHVNSGQLIGKTIIFAYNQKHAQMIVEQFYKMYPKYSETFCQLVTCNVKYADDLVVKFDEHSDFRIAVSVDMLDTGVDIPEILNLVFFKPVKSKIKFVQMIGRGTRLCKDLFGKGMDKQYFTIFDYLGNFEYFNVEQNKNKEQEQKSLSRRLFELRCKILAELQNIEHQEREFEKAYYNELKEQLFKAVVGIKKQGSSISVRKQMAFVDKYSDIKSWDYISPLALIELDTHIAPLVDKQGELDDSALIFDVKILFVEFANIVNGSALKTTRSTKAVKEICEIANILLSKTTIPQIASKKEELKIIKTEQFWANATTESLEKMRKALRDLMQFVKDSISGQNFDTDFTDEVIEKEGAGGGFIDIRTYKRRVLDYLSQNESLPVIQKIRELEKITPTDMKELERILWEELGTKSDYNKTTTQENLAIFVRSLIGLSQDAIQQKFGKFLSANEELNSQQIEFIRSIINYVQKNGDITAEDIINTPPFDNYDLVKHFGDKISVLMHIVNTIHGAVRVA
ncbi:MAG: DEAD/DEAH box helicase family protein [Firmicutes bacterium]|nr:DEAD/DEAH box helicase family protein [Bacillota bacterium]